MRRLVLGALLLFGALSISVSALQAAGLKGVTSIITGHSTVMTPTDLREYADFNDVQIVYDEAK